MCRISHKSGWPNGLRRQTQGVPYPLIEGEHSGPRMRAWVQIPLLTKFFLNKNVNKYTFYTYKENFAVVNCCLSKIYKINSPSDHSM